LLYVSLYNEEPTYVSEWLVVRRHFTQVVLPDVCLEGSPGEGFAGHRDNPAFFIPAGVGGCGNNEADLRTLLPECTYGGDGRTTFALPNLQGSAAMEPGQGPGLSLHDLGETGGSNTVTLLTTEMPSHSHAINCIDGARVAGQTGQPGNAILVKTGGSPASAYTSGAAQNQTMAANMVASVGGNQPHNNLMPYLTLNFCIALQGVFPPRS
jgi:microcystin-dependent protein